MWMNLEAKAGTITFRCMRLCRKINFQCAQCILLCSSLSSSSSGKGSGYGFADKVWL